MKKSFVSTFIWILFLLIFVPIIFMNLFLMVQSSLNKDKLPSIFGYKPMIVVSGSMEDTIMTGDFIISKEFKTYDLKVGDIITFRDSDNSVITHRIVRIDNNSEIIEIFTKGDNNNTEDPTYITDDKIEGVFVFSSSFLGSLLRFTNSFLGIVIIALLLFSLIVYTFKTKKEN